MQALELSRLPIINFSQYQPTSTREYPTRPLAPTGTAVLLVATRSEALIWPRCLITFSLQYGRRYKLTLHSFLNSPYRTNYSLNINQCKDLPLVGSSGFTEEVSQARGLQSFIVLLAARLNLEHIDRRTAITYYFSSTAAGYI